MSAFDVQHRDAFDSLVAARDAGGADLVLTSPPYPDARENHEGYATFDTTLEGYHRLGRAVFDALKPGGVCALNVDGPVKVWRPELGESERSLIAFEVALDWAKVIGFRYLEHCAYVRDGAPGRFWVRWRSGWEPVHVFARPGANPHFDHTAYQTPAVSAGARQKTTTRHPDGRTIKNPAHVQADTRQVTTALWCKPGTTEQEHHAPFSRVLADAYVLCYSPPDGLVCDPFVGSGTVALACHRHGRRFVGGDLGHRERDGRRWVDIVNEQLGQGRLF